MLKKFKLKPKIIEFTDEKFMTKEYKQKVYKNFVSFLNGHFRCSSFTKALYEELTMHFNFIAHYNQLGFYGVYFETASKFNKVAFNVDAKESEYSYIDTKSVNFKGADSDEAFELLTQMKIEINRKSNLGEFVDNIANTYGDNELNMAFKQSMIEYIDELNKIKMN